MILQALCAQYQLLCKDKKHNIAQIGMSSAKVSFSIHINQKGALVGEGFFDLRDESKKKLIPQMMLVPEQKNRTGKYPPPFFLCDNAKYMLGMTEETATEEEQEKIIQRFTACKEFHKKLLGSSHPIALFLEQWQPHQAIEHSFLKEHQKEICAGGNFVFFDADANCYFHEKPEMMEIYSNYIDQNADVQVTGQCLVSGEVGTIARTHSLIRGVMNAQAAGASLVGCNDAAFCSYGKEQAYNAPVSTKTMFQYTTVLNYMLKDPRYHMRLKDSTVVFWADHSGIYQDSLLTLLSGDLKAFEEKQEDQMHRELVKKLLEKLMYGIPVRKIPEIDADVNVYILGLSPNNARLSVSFWAQNSFDVFAAKAVEHYQNLEIIDGKQFLPLWQILNETVSEKAKDKKVSPVMEKEFVNAVITGNLYPTTLYNGIMNRIRADQKMKPERVAMIKAYLIRKSKYQKKEEVFSVSLDLQNKEPAYLCGRLFAVLEKAQKNALGENINATIKDKFFTSATATPAAVFPTLLKLSLHHTAKGDFGRYNEMLKQDILWELQEFPKHLTLEEQGKFVLGYYHQEKTFYLKKEQLEEMKNGTSN